MKLDLAEYSQSLRIAHAAAVKGPEQTTLYTDMGRASRMC